MRICSGYQKGRGTKALGRYFSFMSSKIARQHHTLQHLFNETEKGRCWWSDHFLKNLRFSNTYLIQVMTIPILISPQCLKITALSHYHHLLKYAFILIGKFPNEIPINKLLFLTFLPAKAFTPLTSIYHSTLFCLKKRGNRLRNISFSYKSHIEQNYFNMHPVIYLTVRAALTWLLSIVVNDLIFTGDWTDSC